MTGTATVLSQNFDYYNYYVMCNCVFDEPEAVIQNGYTYEENGVLYCTSATQKGGYWYSYCLNNPLMLKDPTGQLYTWYVDGDNNVLLNTKDGSNDIVRVANDKINDFKDYAQMYNSGMRDVFDSQGWNDHWKSEFGLASQQLSREQIGILGMLNSDWSRKNSVEFALKSSTGSELKFILSEVVSQWTNPMLVASGLSAGVLGWQAMGTNVAKGGIQLTNSQLKSVRSLENQIVIHTEKLKAYKADPFKFDNLGHLKNAPNDAVRQKIIQSRINHLEQEIQTFNNNINLILYGQ